MGGKTSTLNILFVFVLAGFLSLMHGCGGGGAETPTPPPTPPSPAAVDKALSTWHWRNPLPQGSNLGAMTYGNGTFVAMTADGSVVTSSEGLSWTLHSLDFTNEYLNIVAVTFGKGIFLALSDDGTTFISPDGITWTLEYKASTRQVQLFGVTYGRN